MYTRTGGQETAETSRMESLKDQGSMLGEQRDLEGQEVRE